MRDAWLQCIETVVQRKQCVPAEGDDRRLILNGQHRGTRLPRPGRHIGNRGALLPLVHRLLVDAVALGQRSQALLTLLYRSTDRLCRSGALAHRACFHSRE